MINSYSLFDLHCDTISILAHKKLSIADNSICQISLKKAEYLKHYVQVFAFFAPRNLNDDEAYSDFTNSTEYFISELANNSKLISGICKNGKELSYAIENGKRGALLAVEDARIINGDICRIDEIFNLGVRFVTPVWSGESCIGGAHDTSSGLTDFGKLSVKLMSEKGIVMDISHASEKTSDDMISIASALGGKVIATHSNSASVYNHSRNLRDRHFKDIKELNGLVGISLCPDHLSADSPGLDDIVKHIDHYMELGGEDILSMGADFDGTILPNGFDSISDVYKIADRLSLLGYTKETIDKIFFTNAYSFSKKL